MTPRSPRGKKIIIQVDESSEKYRPKKYIKDDGKLPLESILNLPNGKWMDSILRFGKGIFVDVEIQKVIYIQSMLWSF